MFGNLIDALRGRPAREAVIEPPGFKGPALPADDADKPPEARPDSSDPAGHATAREAFVIVYTDSAGAPSERRIVCHEVYSADSLIYLRARCLERRASRTFRVDRIREVYCGVTGEDLGAPSAVFVPTGVRAAKPRPDRNYQRLMRAIVVLMTVARADGRLHPAEADVLWRFIDQNAPVGWPIDERTGLKEKALRLAPSVTDFRDDFERLLKFEVDLLPAVLEGVIAIAEADGVYHPREIDLIAALIGAAREAGIEVTVEG